MLILSRGLNESVTIVVPPSDKPTTVVVSVGSKGSNKTKISLGIDAEKCVSITRTELLRNADER